METPHLSRKSHPSLSHTLSHTLAGGLTAMALLLAACTTSTAHSAATATPSPSSTLFACATDAGESTLYALNTRTGAPLWHTKVVGSPAGQLGVVGNAVLVFSEGAAYNETDPTQVPTTGHLAAFDGKTGNKLWQRDTPVPIGSSWVGISSRAIVLDEFLLLPQDAQSGTEALIALNPATGSPLWTKSFPAPIGTSSAGVSPIPPPPTPFLLSDDALYLVTENATDPAHPTWLLDAFNPATGTHLWPPTQLVTGRFNRSHALVADGTLYVGASFVPAGGDGAIFRTLGYLRAFNAADGTPKWTSKMLAHADITPVAAANGTLYTITSTFAQHPFVISKTLAAVDAITQAQRWQTPTVGNESPSLAFDNHAALDAAAIYITATPRGAGTAALAGSSLVAYSRFTGQSLWPVPVTLANFYVTAPVVDNGTVYLGAYRVIARNGARASVEGYIESYSAADATLRWRFQVTGAVYVPPVVAWVT